MFLDETSAALETSFDHFQFRHLNEVLLDRAISATQACCDLSTNVVFLFNMDKFERDSEENSEG